MCAYSFRRRGVRAALHNDRTAAMYRPYCAASARASAVRRVSGSVPLLPAFPPHPPARGARSARHNRLAYHADPSTHGNQHTTAPTPRTCTPPPVRNSA